MRELPALWRGFVKKTARSTWCSSRWIANILISIVADWWLCCCGVLVVTIAWILKLAASKKCLESIYFILVWFAISNLVCNPFTWPRTTIYLAGNNFLNDLFSLYSDSVGSHNWNKSIPFGGEAVGPEFFVFLLSVVEFVSLYARHVNGSCKTHFLLLCQSTFMSLTLLLSSRIWPPRHNYLTTQMILKCQPGAF